MNKYTIAKLPKSQVEIKAEISAEDFKAFEQKALDEIAKNFETAGFRKGMAPKDLVKSKTGDQKILDRAAAIAIESTFPEAAAQNSLAPLGYPQVSVLKLAPGNPFEYKAVVAVYPQFDLPDYKQIAAEFEAPRAEVSDEDIKRLKMEKERHLREDARQKMLEAMAQKMEVEIPDILVERETQQMMDDLKERTPQVLRISFEQYLKKLGKTEEALREEMAKDNAAKIKKYLLLEEIAKAEKIDATDEEVAAAIEKSREGDLENKAGGEEKAPDEQKKAYYRQTLKTEKVFEFLETNFKKS